MGQKVNPHGLRVGVIADWDSRWFEKDENFGDTLISDFKVRKYLKKELQAAGVPKIEIERDSARVKVFVHCAKPGLVIGRNGAEIEKYRAKVEEIVGKPTLLSVVEVANPDLNAQLVAESIAAQLEKRTSFRRAMKQAIGRTMKLGAKGIKITVSGRLGGAEIARKEHYHEGTIPLQTLRAIIEYGFWEANTTYGKIGVKVWICLGEFVDGVAHVIEVNEKHFQKRNDNRRFGDRRQEGGFRPAQNNNNRFGGSNRPGGYNNNSGNNTGSYNNPRTAGPRTPREGGKKDVNA